MEEPLLPVSFSSSGEEPLTPGSPAHHSPSPASTIPLSVVAVRIASFVVLSLLAVWANHEASKGFSVKVVNAAESPAGRQFDLIFSSNGRVSRLLLDASREVQRALYSRGAAWTSKPVVKQVTLRLVDESMPASVVVRRSGENGFVLLVSSGVVLAADATAAMRTAVRRGMARVWLWDGQGKAPESLLDAMAGCLAESTVDGADTSDADSADKQLAVSGAAKDKEEGGADSLCWPEAALRTEVAVRLVRLCEAKNCGFVERLNAAMREGWRPSMAEAAVG